MNSANAWLQAGQPQQARTALQQAERAGLGTADAARATLLRAELALLDRDLDAAEFFLDAIGAGLPADWQARARASRDLLAQLRADPSAPLLAEAAEQLASAGAYDTAVGLRLLRQLQAVPTGRLAAEAAGDSTLAPWAALALSVRQALVGREDLLNASENWAQQHPAHPVQAAEFMELCWQYGQYFTPPGRIAVLLPTEGGLAAAGTAIRDGIASAFLEHPAGTQLDFLPLGEGPGQVLDAYQQAALDGYQWVIGPLDQDAVQTLVEQSSGALPALLLNWPVSSPERATGASPNWFSLSLSQQAESAAVARRMLASGQLRAIMLLAEGGWGERAESAFIDAFLAGGGEVVALDRFSAGQADHSQQLTELLQIEDGRERRRRLQAALGVNLEFEDSRRDDFDAIFMAADPALGRQLKPQLRFFDAGEKPVYAMSRVYSGRPDPRLDSDLDGVIMPGTRFAAAQAAGDSGLLLESMRGGAYASLHALGRDAWNLLPWLQWMHADPQFIFPGEIGDLHADADGRIRREPYWVQFAGGRLQALAPIAAE